MIGNNFMLLILGAGVVTFLIIIISIIWVLSLGAAIHAGNFVLTTIMCVFTYLILCVGYTAVKNIVK